MTASEEAGPLDHVDWSRYDFIDLGSSRGRSIEYCMKRFGAGAGIGIDRNGARVEETQKLGHAAIQADAQHLSVHKSVRFISMMDFLEHLPDLKAVSSVIEAAAAAATDFLFIFHPSFEGEDYLAELGLKQTWWDWRVHSAHIHIEDYLHVFDRLGLRQYFIRPVKPIRDSSHESILPADAPPDQQRYDPEAHGPKREIEFPRGVWRAQEIFVSLRPLPTETWDLITRPRGQNH